MASITFTTDQKIQIVCELIRLDLSPKDILIKYGVKQSTLYYWKTKYFPTTAEEKIEERKTLDSVYARVRLKGLNKDYFLKDCHKRGWTEGRMLHNIVDVYYSLQSNRPDMEGKEMTEIKKMLTDIVKFK